MRGEHENCRRQVQVEVGSSPHARGAQSRLDARCAIDGIIPACAGSTPCGGRAHRRGRDHPRMRGEHIDYEVTPALGDGSSPHARGAQEVLQGDVPRHGISPACAGSTGCWQSLSLLSRDHPRMRGEHKTSGKPMVTCWGSSPHARGAHWSSVFFCLICGIIPACAGSTRYNCTISHARRDHPRMRGEHLNKAAAMQRFLGSSPHARGAHLLRLWRLLH